MDTLAADRLVLKLAAAATNGGFREGRYGGADARVADELELQVAVR